MDPAMMQALMSDPELMSLFSRPDIMAKLQAAMSNPARAAELASDPDIAPLIRKLSGMGLGGGAGGMGGMGGGFPGFGGAPGGSSSSSGDKVTHGQVNEITNSATFNQIVSAPEDKLIVVDWYATWCGPCKMIGPVFDSMAKVYTDALFLRVDTDKNRALAMSNGIKSMPTFFFYKGGKLIDQFSGADATKLENKISSHMPVKKAPVRPSPYSSFPLNEDALVKFDSAKFDLIEAKIAEFNSSISSVKSEVALTSEDLKEISKFCSTLENRLQYHTTTVSESVLDILFSKLLKWPKEFLPPVLNLVRLAVLHPHAAKSFSTVSKFNLCDTLSELVSTCAGEQISLLVIIQTFANMFVRRALVKVMLSHAEAVITILASLASMKKLKIPILSVFINYAVSFRHSPSSGTDSKEDSYEQAKVQCVSTLQEFLDGEESVGIVHRCLVILGSVMFREESVKQVALLSDLESAVISIRSSSTFAAEPAVLKSADEVLACLHSSED